MSDETWMGRALEVARKGRPSPNPHVGAVVVQGDEVVGVGHHERAGQEHAELIALREAGAKAEGATLYVTLEPCNHTGRTPPCTDAIAAAKIRRVVIGATDPNPHVTGGGVARLKELGIAVQVGVQEAAARDLIRSWSKYVTVGLPYVSLKLALSIDGRIATKSGASRWVTGKLARAKVHALRAKSDAIAVGIGTVLADDPRLTVRDTQGQNPTRIVFDTKLRTPVSSALVVGARETPTWIVTGDTPESRHGAEELEAKGIRILFAPVSTEGRVELRSALETLAAQGIVTLMVEGGAELAGSFLAAELADELHAFLAPVLFGPRGRPGAVDWAGPATPEVAPRIAKPIWELCGEDAYVHGALSYPDR